MSSIKNHLIARLPGKERLNLAECGDQVALVKATVLQYAGKPTKHAYFPGGGSIALMQESEGCAPLEVGMIGNEGMLGAHLALGRLDAPQRAVVQTTGWALRISQEDFRHQLGSSPALQRIIHRYLYIQLVQHSGRIGCIQHHRIAARLASWLLQCQDRSQGNAFPVTQALIANMLGVRRVSITNAASVMQEKGLICYHRGQVEIVDRRGLKAVACVCYQNERIAYDQLLG